METARVKNKYPDCHECGGIRQNLTGACKWQDRYRGLRRFVWRSLKIWKEFKKVNGKQIKANRHILKAPEAGEKVIMTASNASAAIFPRSWLKGCTDEPCVIVRCFLCVTPQIQCLSDLRHIEQEKERLHLCLISYWLRPSSKWHTKLLNYW